MILAVAAWLGSTSTHGIAAGQNAFDQHSHRRVQRILIACRCVFMRGRRIFQNADDLLFGQDVAIIEGEQQ